MAAPPVSERHLHHFHRRSPIKEPVRAATTGNITISTALNNGDTLDGVTLATDDRVLVKDQTTGSENGLYVVGATPVRAYDQSTDDPAFGFIVRVREGTANAGKVYANTNTSAPTIGTTALTFTALPSSDLSGVDFLVGTATGLLSAEIVAGTTPGGELGGTWASPTVDGTHSGSAHTDFIAKSLLTTQDDIIVRDGSGPARLAKGSDGQVLTVDPTTHHLVWATSSSGFSNPMTTKGDLIVGDTGGSAIRKAVGSDTQVLTADSTATGGIKWAAAGGGGSSIVYEPLKPGSPTDDFSSALSGWTAVSTSGSFVIGTCRAQAIDGSHLWMGFDGQAGYIYQSASNVDQEWIVGGLVGGSRMDDTFIGIALLSSAGDGVGLIYHVSDNTGALIGITAGVWDGSTAQIFTSPRPGNFIGYNQKIWFRLTRVSNTWDGYYSIDGSNWTYHVAATISKTVTVARKCIGIFKNAGQQQIWAEWVNTV